MAHFFADQEHVVDILSNFFTVFPLKDVEQLWKRVVIFDDNVTPVLSSDYESFVYESWAEKNPRWCHVRAYLDDLARVDSDQTILLFHHDQWYSVSRHLNRISFYRHPELEQLKTRDIVLCPNTFTPGIWCEMDRLLSYTESARSVERSVLAAGGGDISIAPHVLTCEDLIQCLTSVLIDKVSHH